MFCPKCRNYKPHNVVPQPPRKFFRSGRSILCPECGITLCPDRMAIEFDVDSYASRGAAMDDHLDSLISVGQVLDETRSQADATTFESIRLQRIASPGRSMNATPIENNGSNNSSYSGVIGRYDDPDALQSVHYLSASRKSESKPKGWPILAFVLVMDIVVSYFVFRHQQVAPQYSGKAIPVQSSMVTSGLHQVRIADLPTVAQTPVFYAHK